jgi:DNA polymerase-3 subunit alpha
MASDVVLVVEEPAAPPAAPVAAAQPNLALDQRPVEPAAEPEKVLDPVQLPRYLVPPTVVTSEDGSVHMITVLFRTTGDKTRDVLRLRRIHGIITSYPGNDRFAFHVFERGRGYLLEFPNFTIGFSPELVTRLSNLIGSDNIRVEKITFQ